MTVINDITNYLASFIPLLIKSLLIYLMFSTIATYAKSYIKGFMNPSNGKNSLIYSQLSDLSYYIIYIFGILMIISNFGIQTSTLITLIAAIGVTSGLALQPTLQSITSGIIVSLSDTFEIGDIIEINGIIGTVDSFGLFTTTIYSSSVPHTIPNSDLQKYIIINHTKNNNRLYKIFFTVSNFDKNTNYDNIIKLIHDALLTSTFVTDPSAINVYVSNIRNNGTEITIRVPIISLQMFDADISIKNTVRKILAENNIQLIDSYYTIQNTSN